MTKAAKDKHRKARSKGEETYVADEKALEAELERKYILERFYDCIGTMFAKFGVVFMGTELFLIFVVPGAHYTGYVGFVFWFIFFAVCKHVARFKGTKHEAYGKKLADTIIEVLLPIKEVIQASNSSLASEESRNAHAAMVILVLYFTGTLVLTLATPRYKKNLLFLLVMPLISFNYPRFGIFGPSNEALAFGIAIGLGQLVGRVIDEMRWRHFLLLHEKELEMEKTSKELSKESRKRAMAMEVLFSYEDKNSFFEIH